MKRIILSLTAVCGAALCIGWTEHDAAKGSKPAVSLPHPAKTAGAVADRLDALLQPRFLERAEDFGMDRIYIPLNAHKYTYRDANGQRMRQPLYELIGRSGDEKVLLAEANAPQKDYVVGFLHCVSTLGKPGDKPLDANSARSFGGKTNWFEPLVVHEKGVDASFLENRGKVNAWTNETLPTFSKALEESGAKAKHGEKTTDTVNSWVLTLRPVKAQASCISCHGRAKTGDTLGVMVYAVKK